MLLFAYYLLKPLRESLILSEFGAEVRSYAVALIALSLFFLIPLYGVLFRHTRRTQLIHWITLFFILNLVVFQFMGTAGIQFGFIYFVWVGIFGVMVIAQFWAFAADSYNAESGQRLFPVIMVGASLGALAGAQSSKMLFPVLGPYGLMTLAALILATTLLLPRRAKDAIPEESRPTEPNADEGTGTNLLGGLGLIFKDNYLLLIAIFVVLLNWINSTGEFILAELVVRHADALVASGQSVVKSEYIAAFYSDFIFWVTLIGLLFQVFLVSRIYCHVGIRGALLILPLIAVVGYGLAAFIPIFSIIRVVKILENSTDYSIMNTTRHALFLPTSRETKYEGKTAIDTFFWRFGDVIQAAFVFAGLNWWALEVEHFALLNLVLSVLWLLLAVAIGRAYTTQMKRTSNAPRLNSPIPDAQFVDGEALRHTFAEDTFVDVEPGANLALSARVHGRNELPNWLEFSPGRRLFSGKPPGKLEDELVIEVTATDLDGLSVSDTFTVRQAAMTGATS